MSSSLLDLYGRMPTLTVIDKGDGSALMFKAVKRVSIQHDELKKRGVKFLPSQVLRRAFIAAGVF
jgi:hypothetical protein